MGSGIIFWWMSGSRKREILEGGETLMDVTQRLMSLKDHDCRVLMEFALNIEIQAYDLYRNMANIQRQGTW